MVKSILRMGFADNTAIALTDLKAGERVDGNTKTQESIPSGHKVAVKPIRAGDYVFFFDGQVIGKAVKSIAAGEHVHSHNLSACLSSDYGAWSAPDFSNWKPLVEIERDSFNGYVRNINGERKVGTRNDVWIIPGVTCTEEISAQLAEFGKTLIKEDSRFGGVDDVKVLRHPFGCSEAKKDLIERTQPALLGHIAHPNAGAVLLIQLGCEENISMVSLVKEYGLYDPDRFKHLCLQEFDSSAYRTPLEEGKTLLREVLAYAAKSKREPCHVRELILGVKCGGSGPLSGITGNPLLGRVVDLLISKGASVLITEVPEFFGAEEFILKRAISKEVHSQAKQRFLDYKEYLSSIGEPLDTNPSPGNIKFGLTTLMQKSLGAVLKGGTGPVNGFLDYCERVPSAGGGLYLVYGPGGDAVSVTNLEASGAALIAWVTQLGNGLGALVPSPKIFAESKRAEKLHFWCDYDAGKLCQGGFSWQEETKKLYDLIINIAEGKTFAKNEINGEHKIAIWSRISK